MSVFSYLTLFKSGARVKINHHPMILISNEEDQWKYWTNPSPLVRTGLDHIHEYLDELKRDYNFDAVQSSIDNKIFYLTHEGFVAKELEGE